VRGLVQIFSSSFSPLHLAGEGKGEGSFKIFPSISSLPLRERTKVRGAVKIFSSSFFPLHPRERVRVRGYSFVSPLPLRERTKVRGAFICLLTFKNKFFII
jgi:hypothetical protein